MSRILHRRSSAKLQDAQLRDDASETPGGAPAASGKDASGKDAFASGPPSISGPTASGPAPSESAASEPSVSEEPPDLHELQARVRRLQRLLEERATLLGVAAHDLKTPIMGIRALAEVLLDRSMLPPDDARKLRLIHASAQKAMRLTERLLSEAARNARAAAREDGAAGRRGSGGSDPDDSAVG